MSIPSTVDLNAGINPEMDVLLCCARQHMDEEARVRLSQLLDGRIDWRKLLDAAYFHGVAPLLYRHLHEVAEHRVPDTILQKLKLHCVHSVAHNRFLTETLLDLFRLFAEHGIEAVPLKGPVLAAIAYENPALRAFSDLDIMVRRQDILKTVGLLTAEGYRPFSRSGGTEAVDELLESRVRKDASFMRGDGLVCVEIHWGFLPSARSFPLTPEYAWGSCEEVSVAGTSVPSFAREHMLLFLCAHGAKHGWTRLKWICDVAELVGVQRTMDWDGVFDEARRLRSERILHLGLQLASRLLDVNLPEMVRAHMAHDVKAASLADSVIERLEVGLEEPERWEASLFWIRSREDARDKLPGLLFYLVRHLIAPTSKDRAFVSFPRPLLFMYYFSRPMRLILERFGVAFDDTSARTSVPPAQAKTDESRPGLPGGEAHSLTAVRDS